MGGQFLGRRAFVHSAEIDSRLIVQDRTDIVSVQNLCQKPDVVQIELEQVFADRLRKWEYGVGDRVDIQGDSGGDQVFKLILIVGKALSPLVLDILEYDPFLPVLQIGGNHVIDPADLQFSVVVRFIL